MSASNDRRRRGKARTPVSRDIWIGDVVAAWRRLGITAAEDRAAVAEALGFDGAALRPAVAAEPMGPGSTVSAPAERMPVNDAAAASAPTAGPVSRIIPSLIEDEEVPEEADVPAWIADAPPLVAEQTAHHGWKPPHLPLLRDHWARHIVSAIAAIPLADGGIDESRLIDNVSRLRPVWRLPRRVRRTVRRGVQLLIDRGDAMQPFFADVQDVIRSLRTVVGRDQLNGASFEYTPDAGDVLWLRGRARTPWSPPGPGTLILVISDLGMTRSYGDVRSGSRDEWLAFARRCLAADCPVVALVPRDEAAWPAELRGAFTMVPWDQRTNVSTVLRCLGAGTRR
jgi:hypothetical protein